MNIPTDKAVLSYIESDSWLELEDKIPNFCTIEDLCFVTHVAVSKCQHRFLSKAVLTQGFPFYQKIFFDGLHAPILHRAIHSRDLRACDIILSAGALALCCAQECSSKCHDTLDLCFDSPSVPDFATSDIICLIISAWTKFLQKLQKASHSGDVDALRGLLQIFTASACTYRRYTDLFSRLDSFEHDDLRDFTFLSPDARSRPSAAIPHNQTTQPTRALFSMFTEGAGKAFNALFTTGEPSLGTAGGGSRIEKDILSRRTRSIATHLTQRFLNSMLINAIEKADFGIINLLLDFGFRLLSVPRPSLNLPTAVDITTVQWPADGRNNPLECRIGSRVGATWLETALRTNEDTALLAAVRRNLLTGNVFSRLIKECSHLLMLRNDGGFLPVHLMAALGRIEMISLLLALNSPSLDIADDYGMSALLLSAFYGHVDCVRIILDYPNVENEDEETQVEEVQSVSSSLVSICPAEALRCATLQWHFCKGGLNCLVVPNQRNSGMGSISDANDYESHSSRSRLHGSFNVLHLAIITGNIELLDCLLFYVKEAPEDYAGWLADATVYSHGNASTVNLDLLIDETQGLADPLASVRLFSSPAGLACCLDHVTNSTAPSLATEILRHLATVSSGKSFANDELLHYLLRCKRYNLVGGLLFQLQLHRNAKTLIDWSDCRLCEHLDVDTRELNVFNTLLTDWLSWSPLEVLTKLNLSNNAISGLPICLLTQLPQLKDLNLSCNKISTLPDLTSLALGTASFLVLAPGLIQLDLSNNSLANLPAWIFGSIVEVSGAAKSGDSVGKSKTASKSKKTVKSDDSSVNAGLTFAPSLSILRLCGNRLRSVPRQMWLARRLQCLDLSANLLTELPRASIEEVVCAATLRSGSLQELDVSRARDLSSLPQLPNSIKLITIPESTKDAAIQGSSSTIAFSNNPPTGGHENRGLLHLWLQGNCLYSLPLADHSKNRQPADWNSQEGGVGLAQLAPALTSLDASGNQLSGPLPLPFYFPSNLVHLDLANNHISAVSNGRNVGGGDSAGGVENLLGLDGQLKHLLHLNLRNNCIAVFNPIFTRGSDCDEDALPWFPQLASLDLSGNAELISLGQAVCRFENLSSLELDGCLGLTELPLDLWRLSKLKSLTFYNTPIYERLMREIRAGEDVVFRKTSRHGVVHHRRRNGKSPLPSDFTAELPILTTKTVLDHLKSLPRSWKPYNKVRLMLIGSGGVGKTSLLRALLRSEGQELQDIQTTALPANVTLTPLRVFRRCPVDRDNNEWTETVNFTVWDFNSPSTSGSSLPHILPSVEAVMSAVQQFPMSRSTVYVVVWNAMHAPDALHEVARHLVNIQTRSSNAPVLLVATHGAEAADSNVAGLVEQGLLHCTDPGAMGLSQQLVGHFLIDCPDNGASGFDNEAAYQIVTAIHGAANCLRPPCRKPFIGMKYAPSHQKLLSFPVPLIYHELEEVTCDLANDFHRAGIPPIVSLDDFVSEANIRLPAGSRFDSSEEIRSALTFLHETGGNLLYFANLTLFAIVLDPLWLCDLLIRLLINTNTTSTRAGVLNLSRLKYLLISSTVPTEPSSVDIDRLMHRFQHLEVSFALTYLVVLLAKFELAAPLDSEHLLVPALLPVCAFSDVTALTRQIRITPLNLTAGNETQELQGLLRDSDPLNCSVFTLPRRRPATSLSSAPPVLAATDVRDDLMPSLSEPVTTHRRHNIFSKLAAWQTSLVPRGLGVGKRKAAALSSATSSFQRSDPTRRPTPRGRLAAIGSLISPRPQWKLRAAPRSMELLRVYALAYIPAGFWARLITRLLTDTELNFICGHLYNLATITPELRASLLCLETLSDNDESHGLMAEGLQCGWYLAQRGVQLTLAGGALPILTLEQVGNRASIVTASLEETEIAVEAKEMVELKDAESNEREEKSALAGLGEADYKNWNLRLLRYATGSAETSSEAMQGAEDDCALEAETNGLIVEPFDDFSKYCLIQLHMPAFSVFWPDIGDETKTVTEADDTTSCILPPDYRIFTKILTKVVHHIDCLLEDWYPDLGIRFNQSNRGEYLVHRIIPCTDCVRPQQIECAEILEVMSALDTVLNTKTRSESPAYASLEPGSRVVYGVLVEEMVHWLLTPSRKQRKVECDGNREFLPCPLHSHPDEGARYNGISAPDLLFMDVRPHMRVAGGRVTLEKFLGRGAFGSVFAGSTFFSAVNSSVKAAAAATDDSMLNLVKVPVGVKICSPINPKQVRICLNDWQPYTLEEEEEEKEEEEIAKMIEGKSSVTNNNQLPQHMGPTDLEVALALYKQERRRWLFQPVESCYAAYQELRSELAVLTLVSDDGSRATGTNTSEISSRPYSGIRRSARFGSLRRSAGSRTRPRLFSATSTTAAAVEGRHLLTCLGVVAPVPLSLLLPLAPQGSLSDWMEEMNEVYETENIYPVHQNTLARIVHQVSTALEYLHRVRIVYRDLKPDNILVWQMPPAITTASSAATPRERRDYKVITPASTVNLGRGLTGGMVRVVLSDFGVSRWRANLDGCRGYVGTPGFMAPEVLNSLGEETYSHKVDIYALGILMACIAKFQLPYHGFTNLRFQLNQYILSKGRPDIPAKIKWHCPSAYLDLMSLCWSHEPHLRPEASVIVKLTQCPSLAATLPPPVLSEEPNRQLWRQPRLPMTVESGFGQIHKVFRVDVVEVVTCAVIDSQGRAWIGGYSVQSEPDLERFGAAFFETADSIRIGRLVAIIDAQCSKSCGLACSWTSRQEETQGRNYLPPPSPLPLSIHGMGHPVTLCVDADNEHLWCMDSIGRLMVFSTYSLSLLTCTSLSQCLPTVVPEGDSIWMVCADCRSVVVGLSTGWVGSASLQGMTFADSAALDATKIIVTWLFNSLQPYRRSKQRFNSNLHLCGSRVAKDLLWLGGTSSVVTELHRVNESCVWQHTTTWKSAMTASTAIASRPTLSKAYQRSHNCGRLCDQSPAVTCIASNWKDNGDAALERAWTYSYPDSEIVCWSVRTRTPLRSVRLDPGGGFLQRFDSMSSTPVDIISSIGFVERLLWTPQGNLLAGTSRGTMLKIHWPLLDDGVSVASDASVNANVRNRDAASALTSTISITARALRLHRGPTEACFSVLSACLSLGRGFVHPLRRCFAENHRHTKGASSSIVADANAYFLVTLFADDVSPLEGDT